MYELTVKTNFSAAHSLKDYQGPCERLHGHTWQVEVVISGRDLDHRGMLVDFKQVKQDVGKAIEDLDHQNLNELDQFKDKSENNPTAENLARYIYGKLKNKIFIPERSIKLATVRVFESQDTSAAYREE